MDDIIKREDAIKVIEETPFIRRPILPHYIKAKINKIPSAEPKQGEWIDMPWKMFKCSECGQIYQVLEPKNFCSKCGAKMFDKDIDVPVKEHDGLMEDK